MITDATTLVNPQDDVNIAVNELKESLRGDRYMLRESSQALGIWFLHALGKVLVQDPQRELPEFEIKLIADAGRHAGNKVLEDVGSDLKKHLDSWRDDMRSAHDTDYAQDFACGLVDELMAHGYVQRALEAYLKAIDEDDDSSDREILTRELENFKTIAKVFEDGVKGHENGIRALTWAAKNTHYVTNIRATLPEGVVVPWYLDPSWYENYGIS